MIVNRLEVATKCGLGNMLCRQSNKALIASLNSKWEDLFKVFKDEIQNELLKTLDRHDKKMIELEQEVRNIKLANKKLQKDNDEIRRMNEKLATNVADLERRTVHSEQYSRKSNVRIFGLRETDGENCKEKVAQLINTKLKLQIGTADINAAHRLPARDNNIKPIIVRFFARDVKQTVLKNRSKLRGTGISIHEDLCKAMSQLLNRVSNHQGVKSAWAWNGNIFFSDEKGKVHKAQYGEPIRLS